MQSAGAAARDEQKLPGIEATLGAALVERIRHALVDHVVDGVRRLLGRHREARGDGLHRRASRVAVEPDFAAEKEIRIDVAQHDIGIGYRGLAAAARIAGGPGI